MTRPPSTRHVGLALLALTVATVALTLYMAATARQMQLIGYAPAVSLLILMGAWPFATGWRPWGGAARHCDVCGAQWLRGEAAAQCPACGGANAAPLPQ